MGKAGAQDALDVRCKMICGVAIDDFHWQMSLPATLSTGEIIRVDYKGVMTGLLHNETCSCCSMKRF